MDNQQILSNLFRKFYQSEDVPDIISTFTALCDEIKLDPNQHGEFYSILRSTINNWRSNPLWELLDARIASPVYQSQPCKGKRVLIVGAGPVGLRTAIEAQLLGADVDIIDKRNSFNRNNVVVMWPFVIEDLKGLGVKHFFSRFCAGSIHHINIKRLQWILLKLCLVLGVKFHAPVTFHDLIEPSDKFDGWHVSVSPSTSPISTYCYDAIIAADGKQYSLPGFTGNIFRAKLAIGITMNFVNHNTRKESQVKECAVSFHTDQSFFHSLAEKHGIELENIVYFKDETHYFVMTARKRSLLAKGVLKKDFEKSYDLLSCDNVNYDALETYAKDAAEFTTKGGLGELEFTANYRGKSDVAMFDFTGLMSSDYASRIMERKGHRLLLGIAGDSLLESFWPSGSGIAKGFLGAFDSAWMLKRFSEGDHPLEIIAERESLFSCLRSLILQPKSISYTIDPSTRYINTSGTAGMVSSINVTSLYDTDNYANEQLID